MPFVLPDADMLRAHVMPEPLTLWKKIDHFHQILMEFAHFVLLGMCIMLSLSGADKFSHVTMAVPIFLLLYSTIVWLAYTFLTNDKSTFTTDNKSPNEKTPQWKTTVAMAFFINYAKYVGQLLGGTQWLIIALRRFGAHIGDDVIIDDMHSLYDVHLITIGDHTRLSSTCLIQVKFHVTSFLIYLFPSKVSYVRTASIEASSSHRGSRLYFQAHVVCSPRCYVYGLQSTRPVLPYIAR